MNQATLYYYIICVWHFQCVFTRWDAAVVLLFNIVTWENYHRIPAGDENADWDSWLMVYFNCVWVLYWLSRISWVVKNLHWQFYFRTRCGLTIIFSVIIANASMHLVSELCLQEPCWLFCFLVLLPTSGYIKMKALIDLMVVHSHMHEQSQYRAEL